MEICKRERDGARGGMSKIDQNAYTVPRRRDTVEKLEYCPKDK